jgi:hypothetical protein
VGDLLEFVNARCIAEVARINPAGLPLLVTAPAPPPGAQVETLAQGKETTLTWGAASDPLPARR